jgi:hypothetical protein
VLGFEPMIFPVQSSSWLTVMIGVFHKKKVDRFVVMGKVFVIIKCTHIPRNLPKAYIIGRRQCSMYFVNYTKKIVKFTAHYVGSCDRCLCW